MKFAVIVFATLSLMVAANASPKTCADLEAAYKADQITELDRDCGANRGCVKRQLSQLRITAKQRSEDYDPKMSNKELEDSYDPIYTTLLIGSDAYEGVNVSLGDNPFITYFQAGTVSVAPLSSDDGSISIDGNYCDVEFGPYLSDVRKANACKESISLGLGRYPKLDVALCMDKDASFYVDSQTQTSAVISFSRNLSDIGGGYFSCSGKLDRKTDVVSEVTCDFQ